MIITISDKWRISVDSYNHTLERFEEGGKFITFGKGKGGISKPSWVNEGHYPNVQQCIRRVVVLEAIALPDTDLNGYILRLEKLAEEIK
jgi:hypothetical protein